MVDMYHEWRKKTTKRIRKFRTTVYPSNKSPFASKLCENAFQTIPNISFFDVNIFFGFGFECVFYHVFAWFLRSYVKSDVTSRFLAICCSRLTYSEVCMTENHRKYMRFRFRFLIFFLPQMVVCQGTWVVELHGDVVHESEKR